VRFADFEIEPDAGVLRRRGERVKLQDLPFRLLVVLLRRPGVAVSRDELRAELWGAETFVDAEAGLNTAIAKLREALGDSAEAPRFIETLPKRGYRFVGTIADTTPAPAVPTAPVAPAAVAIPPARRRAGAWMLAFASLVVIGLVWAGTVFRGAPRDVIAVVRFHNETGLAEHDRLAGTLTDAVVVSLARSPQYGVIGNSPLLRTDRIFEDVKKIGEALHADYVVLGQLQNGDAGLLVRAHVIRVSDQTHLWANKIDLAGVTDPERLVTATVDAGVRKGLAKRSNPQEEGRKGGAH